MRIGVKAVWVAALAGVAVLPGVAHAQIDDPKPGQGAPAPAPPPPPPVEEGPIVSDAEFEASMPEVGDLDAPLGSVADMEKERLLALLQRGTLEPIVAQEPEFDQPLPALADFDVNPAIEITGVKDRKTVIILYTTRVEGLDAIGADGRFQDLSALRKGKGKAANSAMVSARATEDERLVVRLLQSLGYYDGTALTTIEQNPANSGKLLVTITATPGPLYTLSSVTVNAGPTVPAGLIDRELPLRVGDPIEADRVQGAEANVSLRLPQMGYPFAQIGQRDILLDDTTHTGDYTLPIDVGPRASFGGFVTEGRRQAFGADHIAVLARFEPGEIYD
ncbi:MAG: hypothetical protein ACAH11_01980, partial [Sphingomonas sp.]